MTNTALCAVALALSGATGASADFTEREILGTGSGSGTGQLDGPQSVDVGPDGSVYVVDQINERIVKFTPAGGFERTWGKDVDVAGGTGFEVCTTTCKAGVDGSAAGESQSVEDVAVSPDGLAVYVTDDGNRRVNQYTPAGAFVRAWGRDVTPGGGTDFEVCTSSCKAGIDGAEGGHLTRPKAIAVGPSGDVYVTETINNRISQFTATGGFVRGFGVDVDDDAGGGTGYETCTINCQAGDTDSDGIAVTPSGEVYATNPGEDNVERYSSAGVFLGTFAGDGSGAGTIVNAQSVDISAAGEILITESAGANAIFRFLPGPVFLESFVTGTTFTDQPTDAATGIDGSAYVAQRNRDRVVHYDLGAGPAPPPVVPPATPAPAPAPPAPAPVKPVTLARLPKASSVIVLPSARKCVSRRNFRIRLKQPKGFKLKSASVSLNGKRVATRSGKRVTAPVDLRGLPMGRFTVKIAVTLTDGRKINSTRKYRTCAPKRR